ncbi:uncharacterized protein TRIADDRAFT_30551 [Trichoplax adhaerens]|uniref:3-hydroxyisobutyryl-CoA hydrolase, mitochondrial n=1 Tax=Trichoplax adhaerens TaxID=10228 RepID=B3S7F3_TRIAD|nr:hypothetical protein TRIADDRAFT_30551 [Trichoplax adhaerens]EDV21188.1 hypothetical protein TRIADDRAFT_30551 [Trichoplax adhaerens]|eukprot:XP_002116155.1 hypothetical protein TRIADDRAFT_30551 [Trichoplax adhaerens]
MSTSGQRFAAANDEAILEVRNKVGLITLNRPKALNVLSLNMINTIYPIMMEWDKDPNVQVIVMKGAGEKAFCAGGDVKSLVGNRPLSREFFPTEYRLNNLIGILKTPYVAFIDGITMGGGIGLSVHGRYRVATERTLFAMPETALGLHPDVGGSYFLPRLEGNLGMYFALTGQRMKGRDVYFTGIATHYVGSQDINELESKLINQPSITNDVVQEILDQYHKKHEGGEFSFAQHMDKINECFKGETIEEIFTLLEKDGSEWAMKCLNHCRKMSPSSMKVTIRALQEGAKAPSLADALLTENRICQRMMETKDFYEGVRAILIDRDNNPKWDPATFEEVTDEMVDAHFQPTSDGDVILPKQ